MQYIGELAEIRSKNAGPFILTIDIFCINDDTFKTVSEKLTRELVSAVFGIEREFVDRYDLPMLNVLKFSLPRPEIQGCKLDRDMHGAQYAVLLEEFELN